VDLLIVGAGPTGCVIAERAASQMNWKVLLVEKRPHIAGNCFDETDETGILIHRYGPHYYRTDSKRQLQYLSRFTDWIPGNYFVKSLVNGKYYPFPINLETLELFFQRTLTENEGKQLLESLREPIVSPENSEDAVISQVGRVLYNSFYLNYTWKQWGIHPRNLSPSVCERIPIRWNRNDRYFDAQFQTLPKDGYTAMMNRMISHSNIDIMLNCDYWDIREHIRPIHATVYSGPLDEYFSYKLGRLPYRSLNFDYVRKELNWFQPSVQVNYPDERPYTRTVEYKHLCGVDCNSTTVVYEYPQSQGEPFYPVPTPTNEMLADKYRELAARETIENKVYFSGRLAEYKYLNMDQVISNALANFERICQDLGTSN
jgi:UDP-galactopyranose mutase